MMVDAMCMIILYRVLIGYDLELSSQDCIPDELRYASATVLLHEFSEVQLLFICNIAYAKLCRYPIGGEEVFLRLMYLWPIMSAIGVIRLT